MFSTGVSFLQQGTVLNRRKESIIVVSVESMPLVINRNTLPIYSITALRLGIGVWLWWGTDPVGWKWEAGCGEVPVHVQVGMK